MTPLSPRTVKLVEKIFPRQVKEISIVLMEQCGQNLPFCEKGTPESLERLRFAVLKISEGQLEIFNKAISIAKQDWRDLLMWAGFGHDVKAHDAWAEQLLGPQ
ncbi:MAG: hypothetical protein U0V02_09335 [Anaerolineales bacterium]